MKMIRLILLSTLLCLAFCSEHRRLDFDWKFQLGDESSLDYTKKDFDDSKWRSLDIPHDFVIEGTFDKDAADKSHGFLPYGVGLYRKHFTLTKEDLNSKNLYIDFDGTYRDADAYINGVHLGNHLSGYTSYTYRIDNVTGLVEGENVLVVRTDCTAPEGWWYDGGGIYRHVYLTVSDFDHIAPYGIFVYTDSISNSDASMKVEFELHL